MLDHIATDLRHRTSPQHSATQALFLTGLFAYISLAEVAPERWNARSRTDSLPRRWHTYFSYLASGPPGHRLEELIALADAGVVRFLGGDVEVVADEDRGCFTACGSAVVGGGADVRAESSTAGSRATASRATASVAARALIDAWLPEAHASRSDNALLRQLVASGRLAELSVADLPGVRALGGGLADAGGSGAGGSGPGASGAGGSGAGASADPARSTGQIVVDSGGRVPGSDTEFALGPFVAGPSGGAFTRPNLDSLPFRVHDRVASAILERLPRAARPRAPLPSLLPVLAPAPDLSRATPLNSLRPLQPPDVARETPLRAG